MCRKIMHLFSCHYLLCAIALLLPFVSVSQNQVSVCGLDITRQTNLLDFTLMVIHEKDTISMAVTKESPLFMILPGECEVIIQKTGYHVASTDKWICPSDTAIVSIEFRLLKENATRRDTRIGRRNSRKMGVDYSSSPINMGGFRKQRAGLGRYFTCIVYIKSKHSLTTHCIAERL